MSAREILAYAITHAPRGQKGGPYEAESGPPGEECDSLRDACRWPTSEPDARECAVMYLEDHLSWQGDARVIRIVRKARPSEPSAVEVLRELVAWSAAPALHSSDVLRIADRARAVLAASGPDPSEVVRAAMAWGLACKRYGGRPLDLEIKTLEAVDAYRKAGGK